MLRKYEPQPRIPERDNGPVAGRRGTQYLHTTGTAIALAVRQMLGVSHHY